QLLPIVGRRVGELACGVGGRVGDVDVAKTALVERPRDRRPCRRCDQIVWGRQAEDLFGGERRGRGRLRGGGDRQAEDQRDNEAAHAARIIAVLAQIPWLSFSFRLIAFILEMLSSN